jgi:cellulase/cellobiase CelA1
MHPNHWNNRHLSWQFVAAPNYSGDIRIAGSSAVNGWTVQWTFTNGEQVTQMWNATHTTSGSTVTARNAAWNGALAANASTTFGYTGGGTPKAVTVTCTSP